MSQTDEIGRIGQATVVKWASQVGATPNPSFHDDRGWDILLQFNAPDFNPNVGPLDRAAPQSTCMVQVKTTTKKRKSWGIKLSNWQRMVSDPNPWFVVIVNLDANNEPESAHLVPVDEDWCATVLKRLRQASTKPKTSLHKLSLAVTWDNRNALPELHGRALLQKVQEHVGPNYHEYVRDKMDWFNTLGYSGSRRGVSVRLQGQEDLIMRGMADLAVGRTKHFPGEWSASNLDIRFGIPISVCDYGRERGEIECFPSSLGKVNIVASTSSAPNAICLEGDLYRARAVFPSLPEHYDKYRFAMKYIEILAEQYLQAPGKYGTNITLQATLPLDEPVRLDDIDAAVNLGLMAQATATEPLELVISTRHGSSTFRPDRAGALSEGQLDFLRYISDVVRVCRAFGLEGDSQIYLSDIEDQRRYYEFLKAILLTPPEGPLELHTGRGVEAGSTVGTVNFCTAQAGDSVLVAMFTAHGKVTVCEELAPSKFRIVAAEAILAIERLVVATTLWPSFDLRMRARGATESLAALGIDNVFVDPAATNKELAKSAV